MTESRPPEFVQRIGGPVAFMAVVVLLALAETGLIVDGPERPVWLGLLSVACGCVYALAGTLAIRRRPNNRTGAVLLATAAAWFLSGFSAAGPEVLRAIGLVCLYLPVAAAIHLLTVFPTGRFDRDLDRRAVIFVYSASVAFQVPVLLFGDNPVPRDLLEIGEVPALAGLSQVLLIMSGWLAAGVAALALRRRHLAAGSRARKALYPFALFGLAAIIGIPVVDNVISRFVDISDDLVVASQILLLAALPIAVVTSMLRGGFNRIGAIEELGARLTRIEGSRPGLEQTLAETLGDSSVRVAFEMPDGSLVDAGGNDLPVETESGRGSCEVAMDGSRVGLITYDRGLIGDSTEVEAAAATVAIWFERERLVAALGASRATLSQAQQQIAVSTGEERRRIAQDLHDGLASRLVLLAVKVQGLGVGGERTAEVESLRRGLDDALSELRGLVNRTMPASLEEFGLVAAIEDLLEGLPCETELRVPPELVRPESQLERTAYFIVAEAVANAIRHADPTRIEVSLTSDGGSLSIIVRDDGAGGARPGTGAGIPGMIARAEAAGGTLGMSSPAGEGTEIRLVLPTST